MKIRNKQCEHCPWKKSTNPFDIPHGYSEELHESLEDTIAIEGDLTGNGKMMACHEHPPGEEAPCIGWVFHQLGPGNNIPLRLMALEGHFDHVEWPDHETQHERFEDTLPRNKLEDTT